MLLFILNFMSIAYVKFKKGKDVVEYIIKEFVKKYRELIENYDVQDMAVVDFLDPDIEAKERHVVLKGKSSLMVAIPPSFAEYLNLRPSSPLLFVKHKKTGIVYLIPVEKMQAYRKQMEP